MSIKFLSSQDISGTLTVSGVVTLGSPVHSAGDLNVGGPIYIEDQGTDWNETSPGQTRGSIHFDPAGNAGDDTGNAITFGASDHSGGTVADAGIYVRSDGNYGTKMYIATTDSYAVGSKTAITIDEAGDVAINRGHFTLGVITNSTTDTDEFLVSKSGQIQYRTGAEVLSDIGGAPATGGAYLPLAGGTMTGTNGVIFPDNFNLKIGTGSDLKIFHNATDSFIINEVGDLKITQGANDKDIIFENDNGSGGTTEYFRLNGGGTNTIFSQIAKFSDGVELRFGDGNDLKIYHDGSNSYIDETGAGDLIIKGGNDILFQDAVGNTLANMNQANSVELYYGNSKKFETSSSGITVTGGGAFQTAISTGSTGTIGTPKIIMQADGTLDWGAAKDYGTLTWDTGYALIVGQSGKGLKFQVNNGFTALTLDTSQNATFTGQVSGITPTSAANLTRKDYVDSAISGVPQGTVISVGAAAPITSSGGTTPEIGVTTGTVNSSSSSLATGAQIQTAIDTATTGALKFVSEWDASGLNGGSPDLRAVATHIPGNYYIVSVAGGSTPNGSGTTPNSWAVGDWCIRADLATDTWQKIDNTQVGNVTGSGSVNELAIWSSNSAISSQSRLKFIANGVTGKLLVIDGGITTTEASAFTGDLTVTGNVTALTNGSSGSLIVGRNASENIRLLVSDNTNSITAFQDSDGNGPHNFVLDRVFDGTGTNDFRVRKNGTDQLIIDTSANATFAGSITGTSASFSASINASGNSNTFGNTTTAALSASSGTFSASVTAAGNSNTFGTTTFNTQVTNFSFSGGPQLKFLEPGRAYSEGMRLIRFEDEFGFHYGENANEEAFTVDKFGNSTAHKKLIVDGNVGIGTTAPGAKLTVNQDSFSDTEGIFVQSGNNAANGGVAIFKSATKVGTISSLGSASNLTFMTNGGVEAMRITNGGGISFGSSGTAFGTSGQILKSNGNTSPTWVAASTVIGGPYLPLAGGTMTGNLKLNDNVRSIYGTNNDLEIYNDGANSFIQDVGAGSLFFKTNGAGIFFKETGGETLAQFLKDGAVNLYHNNVLKFATTSTGVTIFDTCLSNEQFQVKNTSGARYSVFGDDDTGLGDFDGANGVSLISKGKREITVKEGDITFDNYTAAAVTTTGTLNANQGNQAASQDTLANLCVDPSGEVVRGSQEGTWTFTAAQLNALTTSTTGGPILISNPGANKAVIVEETNWMVKYSGTGSMATTQAYEVRQPIWTNTSASISRLPSTKINEIMNSAQGTPSNPSYGFYSRDVPDFNNDARTFSCNQATRLNRLNTNGLPGNLVSISIKLKYRIFNADTF